MEMGEQHEHEDETANEVTLDREPYSLNRPTFNRTPMGVACTYWLTG